MFSISSGRILPGTVREPRFSDLISTSRSPVVDSVVAEETRPLTRAARVRKPKPLILSTEEVTFPFAYQSMRALERELQKSDEIFRRNLRHRRAK